MHISAVYRNSVHENWYTETRYEGVKGQKDVLTGNKAKQNEIRRDLKVEALC
jgi:hypothetical protein